MSSFYVNPSPATAGVVGEPYFQTNHVPDFYGDVSSTSSSYFGHQHTLLAYTHSNHHPHLNHSHPVHQVSHHHTPHQVNHHHSHQHQANHLPYYDPCPAPPSFPTSTGDSGVGMDDGKIPSPNNCATTDSATSPSAGQTPVYAWMEKPISTQQGKTRTRDKYRVVYSDYQRFELEKEFVTSHYITIKRKTELACTLQLTERQVKIWFQNRRAKERKLQKKKDEDTRRIESFRSHECEIDVISPNRYL